MAKKAKKKVDSREIRRKRRIRNVILSYLFMIILIAGIGVGGFFGVKTVIGLVEDKKAKIAEEEAAIEAAKLEEEKQLEEEAKAKEEEKKAEEEALEEAEAAKEEEYTEEDLLNEVVQSCIADMSLEEKVAGLFIVTPEQLTGSDKVTKAGDGTKEALDKYPVGGLIYNSQNIKDKDQLTEMLNNTISYSKYPIFLAVDEGLGSNSVLRKPLKMDEMKSAKELGESGDSNLTYESYKTIGEYMTSYGLNLDIGINADIAHEGESPDIDNMFGTDETLVSSLVASAIQGLTDTGVFSCVKYFPGQGSVKDDTSAGMAVTDRLASEYELYDTKIYDSAVEAGADMIMVGHFIASSITGDESTPCSLSKEVLTEMLRVNHKYDGVIITDSMSKKAITEYYGADEAAIKAFKAGADMILSPEDFEKAYNAVVEAVKDGTISEQRINDSLARVYRLKYRSTIEEN